MTSEFSEQLPSQGTLKVSRAGWLIQWYFPGPDRRHNGEFFRIHDYQIEDKIEALKLNWSEFKKLKEIVPSGGTFQKIGVEGMQIWIGGPFGEGVSLFKHYHFVRNDEKMAELVAELEFAGNRARQVQGALSGIWQAGR